MKDKIILCVVCVISVVALSITYNSKQTLQKENMKLKEEIETIEDEKLQVEEDYRKLVDGYNDLNEAYSKLKVEYDNLPKWRAIGIYKITNYCGCYECNGQWVGSPTKLGTNYVDGRTVGVDTDYIPLGSKIMIDGHVYVAEDTGSFSGQVIDVYVDDHSKFDMKYKEKRRIFFRVGLQENMLEKAKQFGRLSMAQKLIIGSLRTRLFFPVYLIFLLKGKNEKVKVWLGEIVNGETKDNS